MKIRQKYMSSWLLGLAALVVGAAPAWAQTVPDLGTAANFAVLGGAGVTCTDSTITGNAGSLLTVTPTPTCTIVGATHAGDATANAAYSDFLTAYGALAGNVPGEDNVCPSADPTRNLVGDLGGLTLSPGVYCITGVGLLTSQLTLNGGGNTDAVWIFKADSSITPIGGSVVMANGGQACNVYWHLGTAASLDATQFAGNILAGSAITFTGVGSSLNGRAMAKTAVTATGATITACESTGATVCTDRVTGGGWITGRSGEKAKFAVSGGLDLKKNGFRGHLEFSDKGKKGKRDDFRVKGTGVTAYLEIDAMTRRIEGTARINHQAGFTYRVDVTDLGEPGHSKSHHGKARHGKSGSNDMFAISLMDASGNVVYSASGNLGGGNIQLHKSKCGKHKKMNAEDHDDDDDHRMPFK
jgi:hypothetical protein